ncbi:hypothetical protein B0H10DRAFT_2195525 [Mycena sp. CBHHK59/15]|nr:hypothetical protein B0H10DRAFT_2195525 [Mycena sp. CBHHK59/15]
MVVTRASSSPRTSPRSRSSRSSGASSCSSSSSAPPAALSSASARRRRLEAKHTQLYPTTARLGIRGTKAVKRRIVQRRILEKLELFSPYPPEDLALPYNHQGHRLTAMRLRSGYTQNDRWFAGSYHQVYSYGSIPLALASPAPAPSPPASPSPVPAPCPLILRPRKRSSHSSPHPDAPKHSTSITEVMVVLMRISPAGEILVPDSDSNDPIGDLQYPPTEPIEIALDVCTPVLLIAWYLNADKAAPILSVRWFPRAKEDENPFTACISPTSSSRTSSIAWKPGVFLMLSDPALPRRHQSLGPCLLG